MNLFHKIFGSKKISSKNAKITKESQTQIVNDPIENEKKIFWDALPDDINKIRETLTKNPTLAQMRYNESTPLHLVASEYHIYRYFDVIELLLNCGADPNAKNGEGQTPLHCIEVPSNNSATGYAQAARILVKYGANINARDNKGFTPFHRAIRNCNFAYGDVQYDRLTYARELLLLGANGRIPDNEGKTALQYIGNQTDQYSSEIKDLLNKPMSAPSLLDSIMIGDASLVKQFLDKQNTVNQLYDGETLLHKAVRSNSPDVVKTILDYGAEVNGVTKDGWSPLHLVAWLGGEREIVSLLVQHGADISARENLRGMTPVQIARERGFHNLVKVMDK